MAVVEAAAVRFCLLHGCQKGGGNCPAFGWHTRHDTSVSAGRIWPCTGQFGSKRGRCRPERSADPSIQSSGMAGPRLELDPAAKERLSPPESRMQLEKPRQVGDGGALAFWGSPGSWSSGQAPACALAGWGNSRDSAFSVPPLF